MNLVIDRKRWLRGGRTGDGERCNGSVLLSNQGHMCCLGFLAKACGAHDRQILRACSPISAVDVSWPEWLIRKGFDIHGNTRRTTEVGATLMRANDTPGSDERREAVLAEAFAKHGITVTFEG